MEISASSQQNKAYVLLAKIGSHPCLTSRGAGRSEDLQWAQATNDSLQGREEEQRSCPSKHAGVTYAQCGTLLLHRHMDSFRDTGSDMLLASVQRPLTVNKGMLRSAILLQKPSHIAGTQKNLLRVGVQMYETHLPADGYSHRLLSELLSGVTHYGIFPAILRCFSSMNFPMSDEGSPLPEGLPTLTALIRSFSSVDSMVLNKHMFVAKGFSTLTAYIRLFAIVNSLVCNKVRTLAEELPTCNALIRPCPSMNTPVLNESVFVTKVFPTFAALIRPFSTMDTLMLNKCGFVTVGFPTFTAFVRPCSSMDSLVYNKVRAMIKNFPTYATLVRHFSSVDSLVLHKYGFAAEGFPTFTALIRPFSSVDSLVLNK